mmetsp:Transcript_5906/g.9825  ORF Transcript_5906/g.9825 Transcript_5906/m.9825 type:complete len:221 (-) Transcript_5906:890-1552(-)
MSFVRLFLLLLLVLLTLPGGVMALMSRTKALQELGLASSNKNNKYTDKDLKSAYRKRSLETHPDKGGTSEEFIRVAQAYEFLTNKGGASSSFDGESSTMSPEDQMKWAEEMFDHFADMLDDTDATADAMVDWLFDPSRAGTRDIKSQQQLSWGARRAKGIVRWIARRSMKLIMSMLESDNVTINIQGKEMSGKEFQQKRKDAHARKSNNKRQAPRVESDL